MELPRSIDAGSTPMRGISRNGLPSMANVTRECSRDHNSVRFSAPIIRGFGENDFAAADADADNARAPLASTRSGILHAEDDCRGGGTIGGHSITRKKEANMPDEVPSSLPRHKIIHRKGSPAQGVQLLGPYRLQSLIEPEEELNATFYRVWIGPHQTTATSYHRVAEEFYYVLSGRGEAVLNGQFYRLEPGDFLRLPPGTTHRFITADETLEMLNIHCPGSRPDRDVYFIDEPPPGFSPPSNATDGASDE